MTPDTTVAEVIRSEILDALAAGPDRSALDLVEDCPSAVEQQQVYRQVNNLLKTGAIVVSGQEPGRRGQTRKRYRLATATQAPAEPCPAARMQAAEDPTDPEAALDTPAEAPADAPLSREEHARLLEAISPTCTHCGTRLDGYDGNGPLCTLCERYMAEAEADATQPEPQPPDGYYASVLELHLEPDTDAVDGTGPITLTARADLGPDEIVLHAQHCTLCPEGWARLAELAQRLARQLEGMTP